MTSTNLGVFQIVILATFLQAILQILLILTLYFDFRRDALILSIVFAVSNIVLTRLSIVLGFSWYGFGYFGACLISVILALVLFNYRVKNVIFYTFVDQKIITHADTVE